VGGGEEKSRVEERREGNRGKERREEGGARYCDYIFFSLLTASPFTPFLSFFAPL
jgi:hypothetical protein